jgi:VRR-NUC domain
MKKHLSLVPFESEEQTTVFDWVDAMSIRVPELAFLYHPPNETAWKLKKQGVKAGVSDLHLPVPARGYIGLWIELKRVKGGRLSKEQDQWLQNMANFGHFTAVSYGAEQAIKVLEYYLDIPSSR